MEKKRNRKINKKYKKQRLFFVLIIIATIIYLMPKYISFSKYISNRIHDHYIESKQFYFSSDKLSKIAGHEYQMPNNWSGSESYNIMVNMYSKLNDNAMAPNDIEYDIVCSFSDNVAYTLNKVSGTILGYENGGTNEDFFVITLEPASGTSLSPGETAWVNVTANATSPYMDSVTGKILVGVGTEDFSYEIADWENSQFIQLDISNKSVENTNVHISFDPTVVLLDMTSSVYQDATAITTTILNGYNYVTTMDFPVNALSVESVKFYKIDLTQDYSYTMGESGTPVVTVTHSNT